MEHPEDQQFVRQRMPSGLPLARGLYDPANEHDACGVGLICDINGKSSHKIVTDGIHILESLVHRGAAGADPETGDGAGILTRIPDAFFRKAMPDVNLPPFGGYAVAQCFLPQTQRMNTLCRSIMEKAAAGENIKVLAWRDVPCDASAIGRVARESAPAVAQCFFERPSGLDEAAFERKLYILRRVVEKRAAEALGGCESMYICSLSCRTTVYKGLLLASQMKTFFSDLDDESFESPFAIVHQRYSTNTFPTWALAHPFRSLAHNGEINTIRGNINQMRARESHFSSPLFGDDIRKLLPVIEENQSDSACLDNAFELLVQAGRSMAHAMLMLVPQPWGADYHMGRDVRGFYEYHSGVMEPWDGPAALAFTDGTNLGAMLDRNGLRPARYTVTRDGLFVLASETGVLDIPSESVVKKGRLGPGEMIVADMENHRLVFDSEIKNTVARRLPYRRWVAENRIHLHGLFSSVTGAPPDEAILERQKIFGYTREDVNVILAPMAVNGQEAVGSMGNDAALSVLSEKPQLLYGYFKQLFAQVTNPPIDPIRERLVMSIMTYIGNQGNILDESEKHARLLKLPSPVLTREDMTRLRNAQLSDFRAKTISMTFRDTGRGSLEKALESICDQAEKAVRNSYSVIVLSDRARSGCEIPVPALLAASAVNRRLCEAKLRTGGGIVIESGEVREVTHFALLLSFGATAVCPYLAMETIVAMALEGKLGGVDSAKAVENYIHAVEKGLFKIMSKLGISTLRSYRGAQTFEAVGLSKSVIDKYFRGTASRVGGIDIEGIQAEAVRRYALAATYDPMRAELLEDGGAYKYRKDGENHLWTPETLVTFQRAVRENNLELYRKYAEMINNQARRLCTLRGLFKFKVDAAKSIPLEEVESSEKIMTRFVTGAMSFGSISPEAHQAIAHAMNSIGGKSNSGEGGEDPERYKSTPDGVSLSSAIKQIASGRFGVTAEYLANAKELQIKIAQGAKPGEGGQLPGYKVNAIIAKVRHSTPGVTLISPPPHHDIYSIEDLAQLIHDLHSANPQARVSVKLVSEIGIGTIAAGVAKGHAEMVLVSGHDGGTGASPLSSIKYAGLPWELGLAETQQTLMMNNLRDRIRIQTDGQLKTGRDVMTACLLGAEEFGFATTVLVCLGCVMMRKCHENSCPVGVATQDPELRKCFKGKSEYIVNFLRFVAQEVREYLAELGLRSIDEAVGRCDLLERNEALDFWKSQGLDFSSLFASVDGDSPRRCTKTPEKFENWDMKNLMPELENAVANGEKTHLERTIRNTARSVGATLSYSIAKKYGHAGLPDDTVNVHFKGVAGQSFGAFLAHGVTFVLEGEANDYTGKGLSGGRIAIRPPRDASFAPEENVIAGNVTGYGAISGEMFISGAAGERFCVRNSGMTSVVEAAGDHCCEYMTGGCVAVLGRTGMNFGAGMTGGTAYVFDETGDFDLKCNGDTLDLESIVPGSPESAELHSLLERHYSLTESPLAKRMLESFDAILPKFIHIVPVEYRAVNKR